MLLLKGLRSTTCLITLTHAAAEDASLATRQAQRLSDPTVKAEDLFAASHSNGPHFIRVDLVEKDEGDPMYMKIVSGRLVPAFNADDGITGVPGVVAISKIVSQSLVSAVETEPFDIRVMLTEMPREFLADKIRVVNGSAADPVHLLPIPSPVAPDATTGAIDDGTAGDADFVEMVRQLGLNYLAAGSDFPRPTGRDNAYHLYKVTITPNADVNGFVTVSVNNFEDQVLPTPNEFDALTPAELVADTPQLIPPVEIQRSRRAINGREVLEVRVQTAAAVDIYKISADHLAANPSLGLLPEKLVIPANGYLVLAKGKAGAAESGIVNSPAKPADKKITAQKLYNVKYEFGLPFPADDLDNFFRNGGALQLLHADLPAATDSGLDPSKANADLGYGGATTGAVASGAVIISEIMWGLDAGDAKAQYIELHNTTAADIGIDKNEWVIAVGGGADTRYTTAVDTVNNNPATGYWATPGNGGVTVAGTATPTIIDLVSMSRVTGAADGTAAASWAASIRPSANISGRRIGSPGAANAYVIPATVPTDVPAEPTALAAAVAKSGDLMISEIMVASNDGRLPQWIEISNVSAAAVSLSGWSLEIENDSADTDVVGESIEIDLGDVEIGADQVALVVSKESARNSGVGDGDGDLRADRIIDVQSDVSPTNARYSLISEMGFMLSLIPPQTGAVRTPGDVVGNLDGGWELPASEGGRSSLIRREMDNAAMAIMGTDAAGWVLASSTGLGGAYRTTYYGDEDDEGTPGYDAGGALPVELSGFNAARDRVTGAVVITWSTQSELNNAGFFIKRSQQTNGKFVIVNPTMISGAGTTAEKQSYTYTDATADPNVIYYYQIEDVSLDGNRQTLTRAHRLKGHIGAAGKATTTWGELKSSRE